MLGCLSSHPGLDWQGDRIDYSEIPDLSRSQNVPTYEKLEEQEPRGQQPHQNPHSMVH